MKRSRPMAVDGLLVHPDAPFMERYAIPAQRQPKAPVLPDGKKGLKTRKAPSRTGMRFSILYRLAAVWLG